MAIAPRTTLLGGPVALPTGQQLQYTVPAGKAALVKSLLLFHTTGFGAVVVTAWLDVGGGVTAIWASPNIGVGSSLITDLHVAMNAGHKLYLSASVAAVAIATTSGFVYS